MNRFITWPIRFLKNLLLSIRKGFLFLFAFLVFVPLVVAIIYGYQFIVDRILLDTIVIQVFVITGIFFMVIATFFISIDVFFRVLYFLLRGHKYIPENRIKARKVYVKPHPYVPFIYKSHFKTGENLVSHYPLHKGKFTYSKLITNNMGFANGPNGNRDVIQSKPKDLYRINCLGASTTGNYISQNNQNYSYPLELEKILHESYDFKIEVNNFGQGAYNSADILIRFILDIIETSPDLIIIYHGYNDIQTYLTPNFRSDYSHAKRNLGENYWKFEIGEKIPSLPFHFINFIIEKWFPIGVRNSLTEFTTKGDIDLSIDPNQGLQVYRRNLEYLIEVCQSKGIKVVLSTYAHFLHEDIKDSELHRKYREIIHKENKIMKELSEKHKLTIVDNANLIPAEEKYFLDSVHFTPEGMKLLAKNIAISLKSHLDEELDQ